MSEADNIPRIERRVALQWISSAMVALPLAGGGLIGAEKSTDAGSAPATGRYGPDPDLTKIYRPGDLWPLTFTDGQRRLMIVLCDIIIPADELSPSASSQGVHDFVDEWISSPYPGQAGDRKLILKGLGWLDTEAGKRGAPDFISLEAGVQLEICGELSVAAKTDRKAFRGSFFLRLRDLVAGGYYTTPAGTKDLGYRGNVAMTEWKGPPPEVLERLGLSPQ